MPENQALWSFVFRTGSMHRSQQGGCEVMFQCSVEKLVQVLWLSLSVMH